MRAMDDMVGELEGGSWFVLLGCVSACFIAPDEVSCVSELGGCHPFVFGGWESFPLDQIVQASFSHLVIHDGFYLVLLVPFHQVRRWPRVVPAMLFVLMVQR